jgi:hypothetical protein
MAILYTNSQGRQVTTHSYSAGDDFKNCRRKYYLKRVMGWRLRGKKASLEFGKCVESAIQFFYEANLKPGSGVDEFKRLFLHWQGIELQFTAKEKSWADLYLMGTEMLRLFEVLAQSLPIHKPAFQAAYRKEVFPGTHLAGLEDVGYADIISQTPKGLLLIDVKTSAVAYDLAAEFVAMDPQLGRYAWHSGIRDVAFMTFVKARPESFETGDTATLLAPSGNWTAGAAGLVFPLPPPKKSKDEEAPPPDPNAPRLITLVSEADYARFKVEAKDIRGKALEEMKIKFFAEVGVTLPREDVTKQRIQFLQGHVTEEMVRTIESNVRREVAEIERCGRTNDFPLEPSVRFPNNKCTWCEMRGHCLGKPELVDKMLVQIHVNPAERDWLDELDAE